MAIQSSRARAPGKQRAQRRHLVGPPGQGQGLDDLHRLLAAAGPGQVQGQVGGTLTAERPRGLELVGRAQLPLGGRPVAAPVGGQPEVEVADVQPREPAALADLDHVPAQPLDQGQVGRVDPLDPDAAGHDQELGPEVAEPLGQGRDPLGQPGQALGGGGGRLGLARVLCWYSTKASTPVSAHRSPRSW